MSREETSELRAYLVRKTEQAVLLTNRPAPGAPPADEEDSPREFWLPRSLMGRTTTLPKDRGEPPENYQTFTCQVPDWKLEQDNLWDFVP